MSFMKDVSFMIMKDVSERVPRNNTLSSRAKCRPAEGGARRQDSATIARSWSCRRRPRTVLRRRKRPSRHWHLSHPRARCSRLAPGLPPDRAAFKSYLHLRALHTLVVRRRPRLRP